MGGFLSKSCWLPHGLHSITSNDMTTHAGTKNVHTPDSDSDSSILKTYVLHLALVMVSSWAIDCVVAWEGDCSLDQ